MSLIVQKYGGTSVGTVERIQAVEERVARDHQIEPASAIQRPRLPRRTLRFIRALRIEVPERRHPAPHRIRSRLVRGNRPEPPGVERRARDLRPVDVRRDEPAHVARAKHEPAR